MGAIRKRGTDTTLTQQGCVSGVGASTTDVPDDPSSRLRHLLLNLLRQHVVVALCVLAACSNCSTDNNTAPPQTGPNTLLAMTAHALP